MLLLGVCLEIPPKGKNIMSSSPALDASPVDSTLEWRRQKLADRYRQVRAFSEAICASLEPEDCVLQSMPLASPVRWHLAHTTWFFEQFFLRPQKGYASAFERFAFLFNSYYNTVGEQFPQARRGLLSRPTVAEVMAYRHEIDALVLSRLAEGGGGGANCDPAHCSAASELDVIEIGLNHEQQHQELILTDIKHAFSCNPLAPAVMEGALPAAAELEPSGWVTFDAGVREIGHRDNGFAYDNESPSHRVFVDTFELSDRVVSAGEFLKFIDDGGYQRPELWLSLGWQHVEQEGWVAPLYWQQQGDRWQQFTLCGLAEVDPNQPVCHLSYFEADAFARWAGGRLPTEAEWETAAREAGGFSPVEGNFADRMLEQSEVVHPAFAEIGERAQQAGRLHQMAGNLWEWTSSSYAPYPNYAPPPGALGEYNGKFMCNQYVLRGGSCATPRAHVRVSYRNFFPPEARWQFSGIRLARS